MLRCFKKLENRSFSFDNVCDPAENVYSSVCYIFLRIIPICIPDASQGYYMVSGVGDNPLGLYEGEVVQRPDSNRHAFKGGGF